VTEKDIAVYFSVEFILSAHM